MTDSVLRSALPKNQAPRIPFGFVVLAAGSSTRMGRPKQLLIYRGTPLIVRTIEAALSAGASPVIVVLGAGADEIRRVLEGLPISVLRNASWEEGMSSSIRMGLGALLEEFPAIEVAGLGVCDQPHFSSSVLDRLREALQGDKSIACARYAGRLGVPALFAARHFEELLALRGEEGARKFIAAHTSETAAIDLLDLAADLDTPEDYERLLANDRTS